MGVTEEMPLLRTFRSELAKRSSMLVDEDMEEFFTQLHEFEGYGSQPSTYFGAPGQNYVSQLTIRPETTPAAERNLPEQTFRVSLIGSSQGAAQQATAGTTALTQLSLSLRAMQQPTSLTSTQTQQRVQVSPGRQQTVITMQPTAISSRGQVLHVDAVLNPLTNQKLTLVEALNSGLIDPQTQSYYDPRTRQKLSLAQAAKKGLVDEVLHRQLTSPCGLKDPQSGHELSLIEAIQQELYSPDTNKIKDPSSGDMVPVSEALSRGIISESCSRVLAGEQVDLTSITHSQARFGSEPASTETLLSLGQAVEKGLYNAKTGLLTDPMTGGDLTLLQAVDKGYINPSYREVLDPTKGHYVTLTEAVTSGIVDPERGSFTHRITQQSMPIDEAVREGLVRKPTSLADLVQSGGLAEGGRVFDSSTGQMVTFQDALNSGVVDKDKKCILDPVTNEALSVAEAVKQGLMTPQGSFKDPGSGKTMSVFEALEKGHVKLVSEEVSLSKPVVKDTRTNEVVTVAEALKRGILTPSGRYVDRKTGRELTLRQAADHGLIDRTAVDDLTRPTSVRDDRGRSVSFLQAVQKGLLDPQQGLLKNTKTGSRITLQEAATQGLVTSDDAVTLLGLISPVVTSTTILTQIQPTGQMVAATTSITIAEATSKGLLDERTGYFTDPTTGRTMLVEDAIQKGLLKLSSQWPVPTQFSADTEELDGMDTSQATAATESLVNGESITTRMTTTSTTSFTAESFSTSKTAVQSADSYITDMSGGTKKTIPIEPGSKKFESGFMTKTDSQFAFTTTTLAKPLQSHSVINETRHLTLESVTDPKTGRVLNPDEAARRGLIDVDQGLFCNPLTGEKMPLNVAIDKGHIKVVSGDTGGDSHAVKETRAFSITGVIHPRTGAKMTISKAIQEGILDQEKGLYYAVDELDRFKPMPISEAIEKGYVIAEDVGMSVSGSAGYVRETKTFILKGVIHPVTKKVLTLPEAIAAGVVNESEGLYVNPVTGESIPIHQAIEKNLIRAELTSMSAETDVDVNKVTTTKLTTLSVTSVLDPVTGKVISVTKAIAEGILDQSRGLYINPQTGESMALSDAIDKRLVLAQSAEAMSDDPLERAEISSIHIADETEHFETTYVEDISSETVTLSIQSVIDPRTMEMVSYDDAVQTGILNIRTGSYVNPVTRETMTITSAMEKGLIHGEVTSKTREEDIMKSIVSAEHVSFPIDTITSVVDSRTGKEISLMKAIQQGLINKENGTYLDYKTGKETDLQEALEKGLIQQSKHSDAAQLEKSMEEEEALEARRLTPRTPHDPKKPWSKVDMEVEKTVVTDDASQSQVSTEVLHYSTEMESKSDSDAAPEAPLAQGLAYEEALRLGIVNSQTGTVRDPASGAIVSLDRAIAAGIIDVDKPAVTDPTTLQTLSLHESMEKQVVNPVTGKLDTDRASAEGFSNIKDTKQVLPMNLLDAVAAGLFDAKTAKFLEPKSGQHYSLQSALNNNIISGTLVTVKSAPRGERVILKQAIRKGMIDGKTAQVLDKKGNRWVPLLQAIQMGLIESTIDDETGSVMDPHSGQQVSLSQAISSGVLPSDNLTVMDTRTGEQVSMDVAYRRGLVDRSGNVQDKMTGQKTSAQDALKMGLLAVVGAPVLAGKMVVDAIQSRKDDVDGASSSKVAPLDSPGFGKSAPVQEQPSEPGKPLTTIVYARPGDKITPSPPKIKVEEHVDMTVTETSVPHREEPSSPATQRGRQDVVSTVTKREMMEGSVSGQREVTKSPVSGVVGQSVATSSPVSSTMHSTTIVQQQRVVTGPVSPSSTDSVLVSSRSPLSDSTVLTTSQKPTTTEDLDINWASSTVTVKSTGEKMTVAQAVQRGVLDSDTVETLAVSSASPTSSNIQIDWDRAQVTDTNTGQMYTIDQAVNQGLIDSATAMALKAATGEAVSGLRPGQQATIKTSTFVHTYTTEGDDTLRQTGTVAPAVNGSEEMSAIRIITVPEDRPYTLNDAVATNQYIPQTGQLLDPKTGRPVTVQQALNEGIIDGQKSSVVDPKSGQKVTLQTAIEEQIFDPQRGQLVHSDSMERITLQEACFEGLIPGTTDSDLQPRSPVRQKTVKVTVGPMTFEEAVNRGLVDEDSGTFTDPLTGDVLPLRAAIQYGLITDTEELPVMNKPPLFDQPLVQVERTQAVQFEERAVLRNKSGGRQDTTRHVDPSHRLSFAEALDMGYINLQQQQYTDPSSGTRMAILDAVRNQILDTSMPVDDQQGEGMNLTTAVEQGLFDEQRGVFRDPNTGQQMVFEEAVNSGKLNPKFTVYEVKSGEIFSMEEGLEEGKIDPRTGKFLDKENNRSMTLQEAAKLGVLAVVGAPFAAAVAAKQSLTALKDKRGKVDDELDRQPDFTFQATTVRQTAPNMLEITQEQQTMPEAERLEAMNLMEAVSSGCLKTKTGMFRDPVKGEEMTLKEAVQRGFIRGQSASVVDAKSGEKKPLIQALSDGTMGKTGRMTDPRTGRPKTLEQTIIDGLLQESNTATQPDSSSVFSKTTDKMNVSSVTDPITGNKISLSEAVQRGVLQLEDGSYVDPSCGQKMSIQEAVDMGLIDGTVVDKVTTKEEKTRAGFTADVSFAERKTLKVQSVKDPRTGRNISLSEAVDQGIVDREGQHYVDPVTGQRLSMDTAVQKQLVKTSALESELVTEEKYRKSRENTVTQTTSFKIQSVVDPATSQEISVSDAVRQGILDVAGGTLHNQRTGETLMVGEALKKGLLKGKELSPTQVETQPSMDSTTRGRGGRDSVYDPKQEEFIEWTQAVNRGLIDESTSTYHVSDSKSMSVAQGEREGLIKAQDTSRPLSVKEKRKSLDILSVYDPMKGKEISVTEAVSRGLLDLQKGTYTDPTTGKTMPVQQAYQKNLIKGQSQAGKPGEPVQIGDFLVKSAVDTNSGQLINVNDAIKRGIINPSEATYWNVKTDTMMPISEGVKQGLVILETEIASPVMTSVVQKSMTITAVVDPATGDELPMSEAISKGVFDPDLGEVINAQTGQHINIDKAIDLGLISAEVEEGHRAQELVIINGLMITEVKDPKTGETLSMQQAIERGILDDKKGLYFDQPSNSYIPVREALKQGLVEGKEAAEAGVSEQKKQDAKQISVSKVVDRATGQEVGFEEAVSRGLVDRHCTMYKDSVTGEKLNIEEAMKQGLVAGTVQTVTKTQTTITQRKPLGTYSITGVKDTQTGKELSLEEAVGRGILDPDGKVIDTETGRPVLLADAIKQGLVFTEKVEGRSTGVVTSHTADSQVDRMPFKEAMDRGFIDSPTGTFLEPGSGRRYTVDEAVRTGMLVSASGKPFEYKGLGQQAVTHSFQSALSMGLIDPESCLFLDSNTGRKISLEAALSKGYLSPIAGKFGGKAVGESVVMLKGGVLPSVTAQLDEIVDPKSGEKLSMSQAESRGLVSVKTSDDKIGISEALQSGLVDKDTGVFHDPVSGDAMPLDEALLCGFVSFKDSSNGLQETGKQPVIEQIQSMGPSRLSMSSAVASGVIDPEHGTYTDPSSGQSMSVVQALQHGIIKPTLSVGEPTPPSADHQTPSHQYIQITEGSPLAPKQGAVVGRDGQLVSKTFTEVTMTTGSATYTSKPGFSIDSSGQVVNTATGDRMSLTQAVAAGIIDSEMEQAVSNVQVMGSDLPSPDRSSSASPSVVSINYSFLVFFCFLTCCSACSLELLFCLLNTLSQYFCFIVFQLKLQTVKLESSCVHGSTWVIFFRIPLSCAICFDLFNAFPFLSVILKVHFFYSQGTLFRVLFSKIVCQVSNPLSD